MCYKCKLIAIANIRYLELDWNMWRGFQISFEGSVLFTVITFLGFNVILYCNSCHCIL